MRVPSVVLVHGAWAGAWVWKRVIPRLRAAGLDAFAVTLTGVGERAHLLSDRIRLATHVQDVLGLIEANELSRVVLVGHSYGGMVITGVADQLQQSHPGLLESLVYVDAVTPHPGESWSSQQSAETVAQRLASVRESGGVSFAPPDASVFGLTGVDRDWINRRQTPQPAGVYQDPLQFDAERLSRLPRTFIDCTDPALPTIAVMRERVRREPGWEVLALATGHYPQISQSESLSDILITIAKRANAGTHVRAASPGT
ncbi:MAG: alpha/beta hydrolase [Burkholderiales bacterium]